MKDIYGFLTFKKVEIIEKIDARAHITSILNDNRPRSIYQYSNMAPRLSGQNCKIFKLLLSLNSQKRLGYKESNTNYRTLT